MALVKQIRFKETNNQITNYIYTHRRLKFDVGQVYLSAYEGRLRFFKNFDALVDVVVTDLEAMDELARTWLAAREETT
jgi:hypothetical protein